MYYFYGSRNARALCTRLPDYTLSPLRQSTGHPTIKTNKSDRYPICGGQPIQ